MRSYRLRRGSIPAALRKDQDLDLVDIAGTHAPTVEALEDRDAELATRLVSEHADVLADIHPASIADHPE